MKQSLKELATGASRSPLKGHMGGPSPCHQGSCVTLFLILCTGKHNTSWANPWWLTSNLQTHCLLVISPHSLGRRTRTDSLTSISTLATFKREFCEGGAYTPSVSTFSLVPPMASGIKEMLGELWLVGWCLVQLLTNICNFCPIIGTMSQPIPLTCHLPSPRQAKTVSHYSSLNRGIPICQHSRSWQQAVNSGQEWGEKTIEKWSSFPGTSASPKWNIWKFFECLGRGGTLKCNMLSEVI